MVPLSKNKVILIGGASRQLQFDDIWSLTIDVTNKDSLQWNKLVPSLEIENDTFLARNSHTAFVNPENEAVYLFGGSKLSEHYSDLYKFKFEDTQVYKCRNITDEVGG